MYDSHVVLQLFYSYYLGIRKEFDGMRDCAITWPPLPPLGGGNGDGGAGPNNGGF